MYEYYCTTRSVGMITVRLRNRKYVVLKNAPKIGDYRRNDRFARIISSHPLHYGTTLRFHFEPFGSPRQKRTNGRKTRGHNRNRSACRNVCALQKLFARRSFLLIPTNTAVKKLHIHRTHDGETTLLFLLLHFFVFSK